MSNSVRNPQALLVTGGAGFIGSAFIRRLFRDANFSGKIVNLDLLTYAGNPENLAGTGIDGGQRRKVAKGDFIMVPENTPHWFSAIEGTVVLMSLHLPHPLPAAR